jgi:hypothetical protein
VADESYFDQKKHTIFLSDPWGSEEGSATSLVRNEGRGTHRAVGGHQRGQHGISLHSPSKRQVQQYPWTCCGFSAHVLSTQDSETGQTSRF